MKTFEAAKVIFEKSQIFYLIATGIDGNYSYINDHYARAFRYVHENIVGQPYEIMIAEEDLPACQATAAKCFADPDSFFPSTLRKHDGKGGYITTQWEYKAIRDEQGTVIGIFCIGYDITRYVLGEERLQTAELDIDRKKKVLELIAHDQSHKVRMPLSNILGLCTLLQNQKIDENIGHIIGMIQDSALQMDEVIREIVKTSYEERTGKSMH